MGAGAIYVLLVPLIRMTLTSHLAESYGVLIFVVLVGLAMRLMMVPSMPALEDDFYRYLWDGAVTANGANPYAVAPGAALTEAAPPAIRHLAGDGAAVLERVNHPQLKTIYPPVAQAAFALSYAIEPWSLRAWRLVCLLGECISLGLILVLLGMTGRAKLWAALYWLNPLVVKELMNTAHMEAIVLPFVLAAVTLLAGRRPLAASAALGLAIGAKLWPVMLLPIVLRPLLKKPLQLAAALTLLALMLVAWAVPPYLGGLGSDSGFVAYASHWQTNSALFQSLQAAAKAAFGALDWTAAPHSLIVRLSLAATVAAYAIWLARDDTDDALVIVRRAGLLVLALFLLSPAQFPWYASWALAFAPFLPLAGVVGLTVFLPIYYVSFYFYGIAEFGQWYRWLVWIEWLPIWALVIYDAWRHWRYPLDAELTPTWTSPAMAK